MAASLTNVATASHLLRSDPEQCRHGSMGKVSAVFLQARRIHQDFVAQSQPSLKYQMWFVSSSRLLPLGTFTLRSDIQIARPSSSQSFVSCYHGSRGDALIDRSGSGPVSGNSIQTTSRYTDS